MSNSGQFIKSYVERIEKLEEERHAIGDDIRDIYSEAKGNGYDAKTIRWLVAERKIDAADREERDTLRETYAHAIGMAVDMVRNDGLSLRQAAKRAGVSKSSVHRALAVPAASHGTGGQTSKAVAAAASEPSAPAEQSVNAGLSSGPSPPMKAAKASEAAPIAETAVLDARPGSGEGDGGSCTAQPPAAPIPDDDLEIPAFLDRRRPV